MVFKKDKNESKGQHRILPRLYVKRLTKATNDFKLSFIFIYMYKKVTKVFHKLSFLS